ncbi:redoxin domain-containing protein [bacterium]|nr:redoxin domain-containing protein [bacterium]
MRGRFAAGGLMLLTSLLLFGSLVGCSTKESYTFSPQVEGLWERHPSPWDSASAHEAALEASELLKQHPRDFQLARYYMERMEKIDPVALGVEFDRYRLEYPTDPRWMVLDALVNLSRNELFDQTKLALELAPDDPYILIEHSRAVLTRKPVMLEDATDLAFKAVEIAPDLPDANGMVAYLLLYLRQPNQALPFANHAAELNPWEFGFVETEAQILAKLNQRDQGLMKMEDFLKAHPGNPHAISTLLDLYLEDRDWDRMIPLKRLAAEASPSGGMAWVELALVFKRQESLDSTFSSLNTAVDEGFFDIPFLEFAFEGDLNLLKADNRYKHLLIRMRQKRTETEGARRAEALSSPLQFPAPAINAVSLDGDWLSSETLRGEVTVLVFWSTWSGWAKITEPRLKQFYRSRPKGVNLIGLNVMERVEPDRRMELVSRYRQDRSLPWQNYLADDVTARKFGIQALPSYVVLDKEGIIRYHVIGYTPYVEEVLGWMVEEVGS